MASLNPMSFIEDRRTNIHSFKETNTKEVIASFYFTYLAAHQRTKEENYECSY